MAIDMTTVKQIMHNVEVPLYKRTFYFGHSSIVYKNTNTPCLVAVTIYSETQAYWDPSVTIANTSAFYNYLLSLNYYLSPSSSSFLLPIDNPYELEYIDGNNNRCPITSVQPRSNGVSIWFSVPDQSSTSPGSSSLSISCTDWTLVGNVSYDFYVKRYTNTTAGSYKYLMISKSITTGDEYINNYVINGVSYPNVTITSSSGTSYTLSDNNTYTVTELPLDTFVTPVQKEVVKIQNSSLDVLWQKPVHTGTYTATLTRSNNYLINTKSDATLISEISTSTGIPEASITLGTKTYNIDYYMASTWLYPWVALKNAQSTGTVYYEKSSSISGLYTATFDTTDNISGIRGYVGGSSGSETYNFGTSYTYFRSGDTYTITVEYTY